MKWSIMKVFIDSVIFGGLKGSLSVLLNSSNNTLPALIPWNVAIEKDLIRSSSQLLFSIRRAVR